MMKQKLISILVLSLTLFAPLSAINADTGKLKLVSMKVINSKGHPATLKDGTKVRVVHLKNTKTPKKECFLDVASLRTININKWEPAGKGATAQMNLQAKIGSQGHPYCAGQGTGCVMTVEVPDAAAVQDSLSR